MYGWSFEINFAQTILASFPILLFSTFWVKLMLNNAVKHYHKIKTPTCSEFVYYFVVEFEAHSRKCVA